MHSTAPTVSLPWCVGDVYQKGGALEGRRLRGISIPRAQMVVEVQYRIQGFGFRV